MNNISEINIFKKTGEGFYFGTIRPNPNNEKKKLVICNRFWILKHKDNVRFTGITITKDNKIKLKDKEVSFDKDLKLSLLPGILYMTLLSEPDPNTNIDPLIKYKTLQTFIRKNALLGNNIKLEVCESSDKDLILTNLENSQPMSLVLPSAIGGIGHKALSKANIEKLKLDKSVIKKNNSSLECNTIKELIITGKGDITPGACEYMERLERVESTPGDKIGARAFAGCKRLKDIDIDIFKSVGYKAFNRCPNLEQLKLSSKKFIGERAFGESGLRGVRLLNIGTIENGAFYSCKYITDVIGKNIIVLRRGAFANSGDKFVASVVMLENIKSMGEAIFEFSNYSKIFLKDVDRILFRTFGTCNLLTYVQLQNIKLIGEHAFADCPELLEIELADVEYIHPNAFLKVRQNESENVIRKQGYIEYKNIQLIDMTGKEEPQTLKIGGNKKIIDTQSKHIALKII